MPEFNDRAAVAEQYKTSTNLNARIELHQRFSLNPQSWTQWLFDHLTLPDKGRVLELGCGPGNLWVANQERIPTGCQITLSDFSPGMVDAARRNVRELGLRVTFEQVDAQSIPFEAARFDVVIANHMLYHVSNRAQTLGEIQRVLKPGGQFFASTIGERHMQELWELVEPFTPGILEQQRSVSLGFTLENGADQLAPWFVDIERHDYEDGLVVTEPAPLVAYVLSSLTAMTMMMSPEQQVAFASRVEERMAAAKSIRITKASGLFTAKKAG